MKEVVNVKCAFVDRECTSDCIAFRPEQELKCFMMQKADRTTQLLNFIEKKIDRLLEK